MSTRHALRVLCVGLVVTMSLPLSPVMSQPTEEQQMLVNGSLDTFAAILADALTQPANQDFVWDRISTSRKEEQIVDLEGLVAEALDQVEGESGIWGELEGAIAELRGELTGDKNGGLGIAQEPNEAPAFDLYFPIEEHRRKWDGTMTNLLVAYAPVGIEENVENIIAYSVETGDAVLLDAKNPPKDPNLVLIVGVDEGETLEPEAPLMEVAPPVDAAVDPCEIDTGDVNSYIGIPWVYLKDDQEPWWKGRAEVYVLVVQVDHRNSPITHMIHLKKVDYEGKNYYLGNSLLYFFFNSSYQPLTYFHFWEEDWGGSPLSVNASIFGIGFGFTVHDNDDNMGKRYVHRDEVPWIGTKRFSTGYVLFDVDKDP